MSKTYASIYIHCFFTTKNCVNHISSKIEKRVWNYIGGIAKRMGVKTVAIGGTDDHVHILLQLPPDLSLSFVMQKLKSISSKWMNDTFYPQHRIFRWQAGYLAFSVSSRQVDKQKKYIQNQRQKHETLTVEDEYNMFLTMLNGGEIASKTRKSVKEGSNAGSERALSK